MLFPVHTIALYYENFASYEFVLKYKPTKEL